jgi:hypothetical protein
MYLSFFFHSLSHSLSFPLSLSFLILFFIQLLSLASLRGHGHASAQTQMSVRADPWTLRGRGRASMPTRGCCADAGVHPRLYNPRLRPSFLLFLSFAFGWSCGICLATSIPTCKGRRGHKHFEGDPLAFFAKQKFKGCIYPLDACVFSYAGVYVKIFKRRRRRNRRLFLGICRCHGFFGGWCGPFELH